MDALQTMVTFCAVRSSKLAVAAELLGSASAVQFGTVPADTNVVAEGVTVKFTVTGALVVFVRLPVILPEPEAAIPVTVAVLSRTQSNVVPDTGPDGVIWLIALPEQIV